MRACNHEIRAQNDELRAATVHDHQDNIKQQAIFTKKRYFAIHDE